MGIRVRIGAGLTLAAALVFCGSAAPGRAGDTVARSGSFVWPPVTAETGKPPIFVPPPQPKPAAENENCIPALPCDTRLIGTVQKNGAVELSVPAWRW